jgi:hypothetical protein
MPPFILKRAPIGSNLEDYSVLEDGVVVGRIFLSPGAPQERPMDVGEWPQRRHIPRGVRRRADARGSSGGIRETLAQGVSRNEK